MMRTFNVQLEVQSAVAANIRRKSSTDFRDHPSKNKPAVGALIIATAFDAGLCMPLSTNAA
jgi:hypothetical protein